MKLLLAAMAVVAGVAASMQASTNSRLAQSTGLGPALVFNTSIVLLGTILFWWANGGGTTFFPAGAERTHYLGGLYGFTVIASAAYLFPRLGAAWTVALMVLGQSVSALVIDHNGLFGLPVTPLSTQRVVAIVLVVLGVVVFRL
jgi:bacterial/archaeal transporter family-2 protein